MSEQTSPLARALPGLVRADGTMVTFHPGLSGQTHHWKATSGNDTPAVVTVRDESGAQVARSVRDREKFVVFGVGDEPVAVLACDGDGPWEVTDSAGNVVGELLAGKLDPSRKPGMAEWVLFTDVALNAAAHRNGQHLGLRRVVRYSYAPVASAALMPPLALLPLLAGLTY